jgi:NADH-quinone oxidoreductase subunit M
LRISLPILPDGFGEWQIFLAVLAMISIVYGAATAFAQTDVKKLVAYSSVSHMGFAMLGIAAGTPAGLNGAMAVNISHGLTTGMLFLMVGMIYERTHTRQIADLSGVSAQMPVIAGLLAFASFASLGLPSLSGFVGEFLSLLGGWQSAVIPAWIVVVSSLGVLLGAAYMLWMLQRVVLGDPSQVVADQQDASLREIITVLPLVVLVVLIGVQWSTLLQYTDPVMRALSNVVGG